MILAALSVGLMLGDSWWYHQHFVSLNANLTYIGFDSAMMALPEDLPAPILINGKWNVDPAKLQRSIISSIVSIPHEEKVAFVSISPQNNLGQAVAVIRDLKARRICNVFIVENADAKVGDRDSFVPGYMLCGHSIGDAGFFGALPMDRRIHVGRID